MKFRIYPTQILPVQTPDRHCEAKLHVSPVLRLNLIEFNKLILIDIIECIFLKFEKRTKIFLLKLNLKLWKN